MILIDPNLNLNIESRKPSSIITHRITPDIILKIDNYEFPAHRGVLALRSKVLGNFLKQCTSNVVKVVGISPNIMKIILKFMYSDELEMNCQDIVDIYAAAQKLKIYKIIVKCLQVLRKKDNKSLIYLYAVSWKRDLIVEKFKSLYAFLKNLETCLEEDDYLHLTIDQMCEIVTEGFLNVEDYEDKNRYLLFVMCISWINQKRDDRMRHAVRLMSCVQFQKMTKKEIAQCLRHDPSDFILQLPQVKNMLYLAIKSVLAKETDDSEKCP